MNRWKERLENLFSAVAFAEVDDDRTALQMMELPTMLAQTAWSLENVYAAAALAEGGLFQAAAEMISPTAARKSPRKSALGDFLQDVGLQGIQVCYGVARI